MKKSRDPAEHLHGLLGFLYDATLDDALWQTAIAKIMASVGADNAWLVTAPAPGAPPMQVLGTQMAEEAWPLYLAHYWQHDVWMARSIEMGLNRPGVINNGDRLMERQAFRRTEFCQDYTRPLGVEAFLGTILFDHATPELSPYTFLSFFRQSKSSAFNRREENALSLLIPHIRRALRIRWQLTKESDVRDLRESTLDRLAQAVVLLDETGAVLFANRKAEAIFREGGGPVVKNRRLGVAWEQGAISVKEGLRRAALGIGGSLRLDNPANGRQWVITFSPLRAPSQIPTPKANVLALFTEPDRPPSGGLPLFAALYSLTPAETRVLNLLLNLDSTQDIADALQISIKTLRAQLGALFAKTGTSSQKELVRFYLAHLPSLEAPVS